MAPGRSKYKRLPDLYVTGTEQVLRDGNQVWMQALNPLERDEAQHDAHVARSRLVLALKGDTGSDERAKVEAAFVGDGRELAIERLVTAKSSGEIWKVVESIQNDPEWKERLEILERSVDLYGRAPEDAERQLLEKINTDYFVEIQKRQEDEREFNQRAYDGMSDEDLVSEYIDLYLERRGDDVAQAEYTVTELWYATRCCDAVQTADGAWDHTNCEQHALRLYESKEEVRNLPEDLQLELAGAMSVINMSVREAKNSARQGSSSGSSPLPSAPEESTPSTQVVTLDELPGTSSPLSATPSTS